jgi:molecular chaperone HtpG
MSQKTYNFETEVQELLQLMIHSLYSHREVFLRELISNASDAIDKLKFEALTNKELEGKVAKDFAIHLSTDQEKKTLTIKDNGIGMSESEVIENIGRIAHSGTKAWSRMAAEMKNNPELIGRFGVGFYSAFMVSDRVTVITQKAGDDKGVRWESDGTGGSYSIEEEKREEGHGTTVICHLSQSSEGQKEGEVADDYSDPDLIQSLIKKYSDFIPHPIKMKLGEEEKVLNTQKALWERTPSEVKKEEYEEFYRQLSFDMTEPLRTIHWRAEGRVEFNALVFIPNKQPFLYDSQDYKSGVSLYVNKVFVMSEAEELVPRYLRFMKGVIDSPDLSLNVSREILQKERQSIQIREALTSKILSELKTLMKKDRAEYEKFWEAFGATLKEGIAVDPSKREKLQDLFLFRSTKSDSWVSFQEYVERMKEDQKGIITVSGADEAQVKNSPYLEKLRAKDYEVLLLTDRIDEWVLRELKEYKGKPLQSAMSDDLELESEEEKGQQKEEKEKQKEAYASLLNQIQLALGEQVKEVRLSERLTESPVCLISDSEGLTPQMEQMLRNMGQEIPKTKRILEVNPDHPLLEAMKNLPQNKLADWSDLLYQQALINEGSMPENPREYSKKVADMMVSASHLNQGS